MTGKNPPLKIPSAPETTDYNRGGWGDVIEEDEPEQLTGILYAVFGPGSVKAKPFEYQEDYFVPEYIAGALSAWTGLDFDISATVDKENNLVFIDWKASSSFASGMPPEVQKEEFHMFDVDSLRWFMLNSLCRSVLENMGNPDVFYSVMGGDLNDLDLSVDFNPAIAYNNINDSHVVVY